MMKNKENSTLWSGSQPYSQPLGNLNGEINKCIRNLMGLLVRNSEMETLLLLGHVEGETCISHFCVINEVYGK
jgi:hypothetical protein